MNPIKKNHDAMLRTGAMALAAAGASTAAHAATVQITFNNSFISSTSGNHLVTDFGGDGLAELVGRFGGGYAIITPNGPDGQSARVAGGSGNGPFAVASVKGVGFEMAFGQSISLAGLVAFTLGDAQIRGGVPTDGWLDVTATGRSSGEIGRVEVLRFIFDDASGVAPTGVSHSDTPYPAYGAAVPEPSGLGLLALGAGGLLARRRRAMAA